MQPAYMAVPVIQNLTTQDRPLDFCQRNRHSDAQERDHSENSQQFFQHINRERELSKLQQHQMLQPLQSPDSQEDPHSDPYHFEMRPGSPMDSDSNSSRSPDSLGGDDRVDKMAMIPSIPVRVTLLQQRVCVFFFFFHSFLKCLFPINTFL